MNVVCILGSPRNGGNSETLANRILSQIQGPGVNATVYRLMDLDYKGCYGCMACKTSLDKCVVKDGLTQVLEDVAASDIMILATPVYYSQVSGQVKCFIDRTFSFLTPDYTTGGKPSRLKPGKKAVLVITQGDEDENSYPEVRRDLENFFKLYGFEAFTLLGTSLEDKQDALHNMSLLEKADSLAKEVMNRPSGH